MFQTQMENRKDTNDEEMKPDGMVVRFESALQRGLISMIGRKQKREADSSYPIPYSINFWSETLDRNVSSRLRSI